MLRNVTLNQLTVIERSVLLLLSQLVGWLSRRMPGAVGAGRWEAVGPECGGNQNNESSVVVIAKVGWNCGGRDLIPPDSRDACRPTGTRRLSVPDRFRGPGVPCCAVA